MDGSLQAILRAPTPHPYNPSEKSEVRTLWSNEVDTNWFKKLKLESSTKIMPHAERARNNTHFHKSLLGRGHPTDYYFLVEASSVEFCVTILLFVYNVRL